MPSKLEKEQFVLNTTGTSVTELIALSNLFWISFLLIALVNRFAARRETGRFHSALHWAALFLPLLLGITLFASSDDTPWLKLHHGVSMLLFALIALSLWLLTLDRGVNFVLDRQARLLFLESSPITFVPSKVYLFLETWCFNRTILRFSLATIAIIWPSLLTGLLLVLVILHWLVSWALLSRPPSAPPPSSNIVARILNSLGSFWPSWETQHVYICSVLIPLLGLLVYLDYVGFYANTVQSNVTSIAQLALCVIMPRWLAEYISSSSAGFRRHGLSDAYTGREVNIVRSIQQDRQGHWRFLSMYRAGTAITTALCILAVDFPLFPRRLAKTQSSGVSLMDLGVGSVIFSSAVFAGLKSSTSHRFSSSLYSVLMLAFFGLCRTLAVSLTNYQAPLDEYGRHWNFFITLAFIMLWHSFSLPGKPVGDGSGRLKEIKRLDEDNLFLTVSVKIRRGTPAGGSSRYARYEHSFSFYLGRDPCATMGDLRGMVVEEHPEMFSSVNQVSLYVRAPKRLIHWDYDSYLLREIDWGPAAMDRRQLEVIAERANPADEEQRSYTRSLGNLFTVAVIMCFHQILLSYGGWAETIASWSEEEREALELDTWQHGSFLGYLIIANAEGLLSLPGYICLWIMGFHQLFSMIDPCHISEYDSTDLERLPVGESDTEDLYHSFFMTPFSTEISGIWIIGILTWLYGEVFSWITGQDIGWRVSRRFANPAYVAAVVCLNSFVIHTLRWIDQTTSSFEYVHFGSELITAISRHQLAFFLMANLLTGLVNFSMDTLQASSLLAFSVLLLYSIVLSILIIAYKRYQEKQKVKMNRLNKKRK